jgi:hypothetical protein
MARRQVPPAVLVIAVLHLIFGGVGVLCLGVGGLMDLAGGQKALAHMGTPEQQRQAEARRRRTEVTDQVHAERVPLYRIYSTTNKVLSVLFSFALVASGLGLLYLQPWARWLSVGYAVLSLLANVVALVWTVAFMNAAEEEAFRRLPPQTEQEQMAYSMVRTAGPLISCMPALLAAYPAAVLIVMLLPSTGRAFRARGAVKKRRRVDEYDEDPGDYGEADEDGDDDRIRRRPRR